MNEQEELNLDRARTLICRLAGDYPDLLVVRMMNNALLFASTKFGAPLEFELDSAGGCRLYDMEEAFDRLEEEGEFTRDEKKGVMRVSPSLADPADPFGVGAAVGFPLMLEAMGKRPEIPGDDEEIRMLNELLAMMLSIRQCDEVECRPAECLDRFAIMAEYKVYHSSPARQERADAMCERLLDALCRWHV